MPEGTDECPLDVADRIMDHPDYYRALPIALDVKAESDAASGTIEVINYVHATRRGTIYFGDGYRLSVDLTARSARLYREVNTGSEGLGTVKAIETELVTEEVPADA